MGVSVMTCKSDIASLRFLRWTILFPLVIYMTLFFIKYKKTVPLKSQPPTEEVNNVENLFLELESATVGEKLEKNLARFRNMGLSRKDNERMREVERIENQDNPRIILEDIFHRADTDEDETLDIQELAKWIHAKITDHIDRAMRENIGLFTAIDNNPRNGEISWEEYHAHFLRSHGLSESYITSHNKKHSELSRQLKEIIMRDRARWSEVAATDPEKLSLDEFLAFTHPESSHRALLQMVEDLFEKFDRDGDEQLTEDEFADLPSDGMGLDLREEPLQPVGGSEERRKEFRHLIDKNKDGKADRTELLMYIDPRNPRHAIQEAQHLIDLSDLNHDGKLNLSEILSKTDLFLGSKMVDTERSFHDEF
ncbi:45 kDa calcium-binding protein [Belonocnema kinseyi]|uniref:45 kDa calcium-binding protein n=1 Tax=Belonocnema kinseyi TaxID=2817044 RepID=UPI00143DAB86|nr:45 kDa calcium-binding protein [Belonocnema kinseyi]